MIATFADDSCVFGAAVGCGVVEVIRRDMAAARNFSVPLSGMPPGPVGKLAARTFLAAYSSPRWFHRVAACLPKYASSAAPHKPRIMLGIESTFDDTAIGVVNEKGDILAHAARSQVADHAAFVPAFHRAISLQTIF